MTTSVPGQEGGGAWEDGYAAAISRVEEALAYSGEVSCGGLTVDADGCYVADLAARVRRSLGQGALASPAAPGLSVQATTSQEGGEEWVAPDGSRFDVVDLEPLDEERIAPGMFGCGRCLPADWRETLAARDAALRRVEALCSQWEALGVTSVYESAVELAGYVRAAIRGGEKP